MCRNGTLQIAGNENFWSHHMASLRRIIAQRRDVYPSEPHRYVVFWARLIDICALLSGRGDGALVADIGQDDDELTGEEMRECLDFISPASATGAPWAREHCPSPVLGVAAIGLFQVAIKNIAEVGFVARGMRQAAPNPDANDRSAQHRGWLQQIATIRDMITRDWHAQMSQSNGVAERTVAPEMEEGPDGMAVDLIDWVSTSCPFLFMTGFISHKLPYLPHGPSANESHQATMIYHASILYTHTSMFPEQPLYFDPSTDGLSLITAASAILDRATTALSAPNPRLERRYFVFALFMAGVTLAVTIPPRHFPTAPRPPLAGAPLVESGEGPRRALELLRMLEAASIGRSTGATCRLLEGVVDASAAARGGGGGGGGGGEDGPVAVDWMAVAESMGVEVVHSGF